ncbi:MAG: DUF493 domain-containing protein [Betaproteobacteria bacterium]|jgi:hypothetical protein
MTTPSLLEFPCDFPIKILGKAQPGYAQAILSIVQRHIPSFDGAQMQMRPSAQGKYLSLTCTLRATSQEELDQLYRELSSHPMVSMVL